MPENLRKIAVKLAIIVIALMLAVVVAALSGDMEGEIAFIVKKFIHYISKAF
jgi:hypothetical protein